MSEVSREGETPADSGIPDNGTPDSGIPDSGIPDNGTPDSGIPDRGIPPQEGAPREHFARLTGTYDTGRPGPLVVALGGVHGNEPGGVFAQRRVLARLQAEQLPLRGRFVALAGNIGALEGKRRFTERDLNRQWLTPQVEALRSRDPADDDAEDGEQRGLLAEFDRYVAEAKGPVVFTDLHTSSAEGPPFSCLSDTMPNRRLALALPVPVILGLEEAIDGAVMEYFNERGHAAVAFEGGQHEGERTVDSLEAILWLLLVASGALAEKCLPDVERFRHILRQAARGAPHAVEVRQHHKIKTSDEFAMRPGFQSFERVEQGQVLARDRTGEVLASESGRVLLPLYQGLGEDGFFLVRDVPRFWLKIASCLRGLGMRALLPLLPGVRRDRDREGVLLVDSRLARWFVIEFFHLLGYRRCRPEGGHLVFTRRIVAPSTRLLPWRA